MEVLVEILVLVLYNTTNFGYNAFCQKWEKLKEAFSILSIMWLFEVEQFSYWHVWMWSVNWIKDE